MASLKDVESVARVIHAAQTAALELDDYWATVSAVEKAEIMDGVLAVMLKSPVFEPDPLFLAICNALLYREYVQLELDLGARVAPRAPRAVEPAEDSEWVTDPTTGAKTWTGRAKPDRPLRTATPEMLAKIQARIEEGKRAEAVKGKG